MQELGAHPEDGQMVTAAVGVYGPYVSHNSLNAPLPKVHCSHGFSVHALHLSDTLQLLSTVHVAKVYIATGCLFDLNECEETWDEKVCNFELPSRCWCRV